MSIDNNHNKIWLRCVRERAFDCGECERERVHGWMCMYYSLERLELSVKGFVFCFQHSSTCAHVGVYVFDSEFVQNGSCIDTNSIAVQIHERLHTYTRISI